MAELLTTDLLGVYMATLTLCAAENASLARAESANWLLARYLFHALLARGKASREACHRTRSA